MDGKSWVMYVVMNDTLGFLTDDESYNHEIGYAKLFWTQDFAWAAINNNDYNEHVLEIKITVEGVVLW